MTNFVIITLINGLTVVGYIDSKNDTSITLFMPMIIMSKPDADVPYFQLAPYDCYSRLSTFNKRYIMSIAPDPIPPVINLWNQIVDRDQKQLQATDNSETEDLDKENEKLTEDNVISIFKDKPTVH